MLRIRLYGRDPDDVQLGCDVLAAVLRGAGLAAHICAGDDGDGQRADAAVVLDPELIAGVPAAALTDAAVLYVNAPGAPCGRAPHAGRVRAANAAAIARRHGLDSRVATAMVGVFAGASGVVALDRVVTAVADRRPAARDAHVAAVAEGYRLGEAVLEKGWTL
ncbi:MAG TPA: 2-oxoacid:acceptor oxidoreductase family protein [Methylomirabilota bacterium]|nr:2-oxoacid:acceptor oxidoreductase family protein [Methylomirabilota bacterium]